MDGDVRRGGVHSLLLSARPSIMILNSYAVERTRPSGEPSRRLREGNQLSASSSERRSCSGTRNLNELAPLPDAAPDISRQLTLIHSQVFVNAGGTGSSERPADVDSGLLQEPSRSQLNFNVLHHTCTGAQTRARVVSCCAL